MNDTTSLPTLFIYGAWVWKVGVVLAGALGAALTLALLGIVNRARTKAICADMMKHQAAAEVRGKLRAGAAKGTVVAQTIEAEPVSFKHPTGRAHLRHESLAIHAADGRVIELVGPARVFASAASVRASGGVPRQLGDAELERAKQDVPWLARRAEGLGTVQDAVLHRLREGDEVIARGVLETAPSPDESSFRDAKVRHTLRGDDAPIAVCARRSRPVRGLPLLAPALGAVIFALFGYAVQRSQGEQWRDACRAMTDSSTATKPSAPPTWQPFDARHPCVRASATSVDREQAVHTAAETLRATYAPTEAAFRQMIAVTRFAFGCSKAVELLASYDHPTLTEELARSCNDRRALHHALIAQGRFEDAVRVAVPAQGDDPELPALATLILAARWADAAAKLEPTTSTAPKPDGFAFSSRCHAALLRHWAGDATARAYLQAASRARGAQNCLPMLLESSDPAARREILASLDETTRLDALDAAPMQWTATLEGLIPWPWLGYNLEGDLTRPSELRLLGSWSKIWLSKLAPAPAEPGARREHLRWRTAAHIFDGDFTSAETTAREAVSLVSDPPKRWDTGLHLPAVVRYFQGRTELGFELPTDDEEHREALVLIFGELLLRAGQPLQGMTKAVLSDDLEVPFANAQAGDASMLVATLADREHTYHRYDQFTSVLPRVTVARDQLASQLRWRHREPYSHRGRVHDLIARVFARREALRAAGLSQDMAQQDAIYRRFDAALSDRRRLVSLAWLEAL